ncbi:MAG: toprim domain-containing protein [Thermodesulfobacteriota bacterium]
MLPINYSEFRSELESGGLCPDEIFADGKIHRCGTAGKELAKDGAYTLHEEGFGWWKNYRTGQSGTWKQKGGNGFSLEQKKDIQLKMKQRKMEAHERAELAAGKAQSIWTKAPDCTEHPYLNAKGVKPCSGLKVINSDRLVVPVQNWDGKIISLQFISAEGEKRFLGGAKVAGGFFHIHGTGDLAYIVEGLATGLSVSEATGANVFCAFDCGNLKSVAQDVHSRHPECRIVLAGDNDCRTKGNPGLTKGREAAHAAGGKLALPSFPLGSVGTDFNDLAMIAGLDEVRRQLAEAQVVIATSPQASQTEAEIIDEELAKLTSPWPTLPPQALIGLAGEFVRLATENSEADPAAVLATFLVRFGIECGPASYFAVGDTRHYPRLFVVVIGNSSKARKGTSSTPVNRLFERVLDDYLPAMTSPGPLSTGEGLICKVRDPRQEWHVDRKSGEGAWVVIDPGENNKRLFVIDEEFASALKCIRREGNTLSTILRCFWDSGNCEPLTKQNKTKCTNAHVGIVTHITEAELLKLLSETETLSGFANRFLWVCARRTRFVPIPHPLDNKELLRLQETLFSSIQLANEGGEVIMDKETRELWVREYSDLTQDSPGLSGCVVNRGEAQVTRLALIYALLDGQRVIQAHHLTAALAMWKYAHDSALKIFGRGGDDPIQAQILNLLKKSPLSTTELHRRLGNHSKGLKNALAALLNSGRILKTEKPTGGARPQLIYSAANFANFANSPCSDSQSSQTSQDSHDKNPTDGSPRDSGDLPDQVEI